MVLFAGCERKVYYWKIAYDLDRVTSIQIVDAASGTNYEVIKVLDAELIAEAYYDIEHLEMERYGPNLKATRGICLVVTFDTGEYDIIAKNEPQHFIYEGDELHSYITWLWCDQDDFDKLVEKYM